MPPHSPVSVHWAIVQLSIYYHASKGAKRNGWHPLTRDGHPASLSRNRDRTADGDVVRLRHRHDVRAVLAHPGRGAPRHLAGGSLAVLLQLRRHLRLRRNAPCDGTGLRRVDAHLGLQRSRLDEPAGFS